MVNSSVCGALSASLLLLLSSTLTAATPVLKRQNINQNFPDPSIIEVSGTYYAFATNNGAQNVPIATSSSPSGPWTVTGADALPSVPSWASPANVWAPFVQQLASGSFVLYFAGQDAASTAHHCVGMATAGSVTGPYAPLDSPLACPLDQGGAIDPAGFVDADGTLYVAYKVDGNSIGNGGSCGNSVAPIVPTPIMLQQMAADGVSPVGDPVQLLDRSDADGPLIEAPSLVRSADGVYVLFFSSNCYSTTLYDLSYATADSVRGPYTKSSAPLLVSGDYGLEAPGSACALQDGSAMVFHANCDAGRCMFERSISISGTTVST